MGKREEFGRLFLYFVFVLWSGTEVLFSSTLNKILWWEKDKINDQMAIIILGLLLVQIVFFQKYQLSEMIIIAMISLPIIYATLNSNHNRMMSTWIFIIAAKYIDFDKLIRVTYYVELWLMILIIYLFEIGFISEYTMYRGTILRHSLGFSHPNQLGVRIFLLVICRCYIRREKFNFIDWSIIIAAAIFVQRVADSKTSYYALYILSVIMAVYVMVHFFGGELEKYSNIMIVVAIGANVLSVFLSYIQVKKYPLLKAIDTFMSKRFSLCHKTLQYYGVKLFGQDIKLIFPRPGIGRMYHFWLDNAYMSILLRYGVVVFLIFSSLYIWTMVLLKNTGHHILVSILCLYAIYGIMENNFFSMSQNIFLLLLSYPIYGNMDIVGAETTMKLRMKLSW